MKSKHISINTALKFAVDKHKLTFREGEIKGIKIPYIIHPMQVMALLVEWQIVDETILRAALCHDILENTKTSPKEMIAKIGKTATSIVEELRQSEIDETFGEDTCRKFITPTIDYLKYELEKLGSFFVKKELKL